MRDLELHYGGLELSGQPLVADGAARTLAPHADVVDEPVEPPPGFFIADVERMYLRPKGAQQLIEMVRAGHGWVLSCR